MKFSSRPLMPFFLGLAALCVAWIPFWLFEYYNDDDDDNNYIHTLKHTVKMSKFNQTRSSRRQSFRRQQQRQKQHAVQEDPTRPNKELQSSTIPSKECLIVFHIPKCGGSSLLYAMRYFALERGWQFYNYHGDGNGGEEQTLKIGGRSNGSGGSGGGGAIHYGHFFYSNFLHQLHNNNTTSSNDDCYKMTILRNPIDRVISHFYYWQYHEQDWTRVPLLKNECHNYPQKKRNFNQFSNLISRMLIGGKEHGTVSSNNGSPYNESLYKDLPRQIWHIFQSESNECQYAYNTQDTIQQEEVQQQSPGVSTAIQHLRDMDLVCFLDDFDNCLTKTRQLLGLSSQSMIITAPHMNAASSSSSTNSAAGKGTNAMNYHDLAMKNQTIRQWVAYINQDDIALYDWANGYFRNQTTTIREMV